MGCPLLPPLLSLSSQLALQQDCGLTHHSHMHRSHRGPVSVQNGKMSSQPRIYTAWCRARDVLLKTQFYESHACILSLTHTEGGLWALGKSSSSGRRRSWIPEGGVGLKEAWRSIASPFTLSLAAQQTLLTLATVRTAHASFGNVTLPRAPRGSPGSLRGQSLIREGEAYLTHAHSSGWPYLVISTSKLPLLTCVA